MEALARLPVRLTYRLGRSWPATVGLLAAGTGILGAWFPRRVPPDRAGLFRQAGLACLVGALLDLLLQAVQRPLRLAYPPLPAAWFALILGRGLISSAIALLALLPGGRRVPMPRLRVALGVAHAGLTLLTVYTCFYEAPALRTRRLRVVVPGWRGRLRIVHLSDLHIERLTRRDEAMLARVRAARPDLLLLTGDYISADWRDPAGHATLRRVLCALGAVPTRQGAFAVLGNADESRITRSLFAGSGIRLLEEERVGLDAAGQPVELLGVSCRHDGRGAPRARQALADFGTTLAVAGPKRPGTLRILLHHTPDLAGAAAGAGVDLYLCGHTHGGQIRLPGLGALFTSSRYGRRYDRGLRRLPGGGLIYTTTGVGLEGMGLPRARFGCPPEIAVLDVVGTGG